jgi:Trk K+ transport system NAD-binding subunit
VLNFGRLLLDKGSRREAWQIALASTYRDHVIVCGLGRVGLRTVQQLIDAGYEPVVIEQDWSSEFVEAAVNNKVPVVAGDAREPLTLQRAGMRHARAVVAAINDDLLNLEVALTVRSLQPSLRVILRVFNDDLDHNLERTLGRNTAFSASALAAPTYAAAAVSRDVDVVVQGASERLAVSQVRIEPGGQLLGPPRAHELQQRVRILHRSTPDGRQTAPDAATPLKAGDCVTVLGSVESLERVRRRNLSSATGEAAQSWPVVHISENYSSVIICGLGKVGYRVVRQLHSMKPRPRIVVVRLGGAPNDFPQRISQLDGIQTVLGDGRELSVLREAGLDTAFSIAALTSDDLLNLQIGLAARQLRPDIHIVMRAFSDTLADQLSELFSIRTAYSTSALASPTLAAAALIGDVGHGFTIAGRLHTLDRCKLAPDSPLINSSIEQLRSQAGLLVVELVRGSTVVSLPPTDTLLQTDDTIVIVGPIEQIARLRAARRRAF